MPKAKTAPTQTADDLRAMKAQLEALKQQRNQANTDLQSWSTQVGGPNAAKALGEVQRLSSFIPRMDADILKQQTDYDALAEALKTSDEKLAEQAAAQLRDQQQARHDEILAELPALVKSFNQKSQELRSQYDEIRALILESSVLAPQLDPKLGKMPILDLRLPQLHAAQFSAIEMSKTAPFLTIQTESVNIRAPLSEKTKIPLSPKVIDQGEKVAEGPSNMVA